MCIMSKAKWAVDLEYNGGAGGWDWQVYVKPPGWVGMQKQAGEHYATKAEAEAAAMGISKGFSGHS